MAQVIYRQPLTSTPIPNNNNGGAFIEAAVIHEPVASAIGVGASRPYIAVYLETVGGETPETFTNRIGEVKVTYTDGSVESLIKTSQGGNALPEPVATAEAWRVVRADGMWDVIAAAPTPRTSVAGGSSAATRERLPLSATKELDYVDVFLSE